MACDHPMIRVFHTDQFNPETGKPLTFKIFGSKQILADKTINKYYRLLVECSKENIYTLPYVDDNGFKYPNMAMQLVPCGHCIGCRLEYSRQWAIRCTLEALQHECNYFLTLTYDDINLPTNPYSTCIDSLTGEVLREGHSHPLVPKHLQKFMKDLRQYWQYHYDHVGVRYFACGEYGGKSGRPHLHLILFNCPIEDLSLYKRNFQDKPLYNSKVIDKLWKKGYSVIAECNFETCAYVARYIMKKQTGNNKQIYDMLDIVPEFTRMSRDPGIARSYYDENTDKIYKYDKITIIGSDGKALQPCPPKYFDKLYADLDPEGFENIKAERLKKMASAERTRDYETGLSKATHIRLQCEQRDRALMALKRVN